MTSVYMKEDRTCGKIIIFTNENHNEPRCIMDYLTVHRQTIECMNKHCYRQEKITHGSLML